MQDVLAKMQEISKNAEQLTPMGSIDCAARSMNRADPQIAPNNNTKVKMYLFPA